MVSVHKEDLPTNEVSDNFFCTFENSAIRVERLFFEGVAGCFYRYLFLIGEMETYAIKHTFYVTIMKTLYRGYFWNEVCDRCSTFLDRKACFVDRVAFV